MNARFRFRLISAAVPLAALILSAVPVSAQTEPVIGLHHNTPNVVALANARITIAPGKVLPRATLVIRDGYLEGVGEKLAAPPDAVVRDLDGMTVYPGFIDLHSHYGVADSAAAGQDSATESAGPVYWNPAVHPERRAVDDFSPDPKAAATLRAMGFAAVMTVAPSGIFRGSAALVLLDDASPNRSVLAGETAQVIAFTRGPGLEVGAVRSYPVSLQGSIALIRQAFYDADWYGRARAACAADPTIKPVPEVNLSLEALAPFAAGRKPVLMEADNELDVLRAVKIAREFNLDLWVVGGGGEYRRLAEVKASRVKLVLPVNFPEAPDVSSPEKELDVTLRQLKHWYFAPENPARLAESGVALALTADRISKPADFLAKLRLAVKRGLKADQALAALTVTPASWLGMSDRLGSLEKGKIANLIVADGDIFDEKTKIIETWVRGARFEVEPLPDADIRGAYSLELRTGDRLRSGTMELTGEVRKPKADLEFDGKEIKGRPVELQNRLIAFTFPGDSLGIAGIARLSGAIENKRGRGDGLWGDGSGFAWTAELTAPFQEKPDTSAAGPFEPLDLTVVYPDGAFGRAAAPEEAGELLVRDAVIWTCGPEGVLEDADLLVRKGKIAAVGRDLKAGRGATVIEAAGRQVTPGIIDAHSHIAIAGGVNEGTHAITSETRIGDVLDVDDVNIYRQLAGGVTTSCLIHGSANPIGGQYALVKLRWGETPDGMLLQPARPGIKFALGENVKQSNWGDRFANRYPQTRMGVEQFLRDSFLAAQEYRREWREYDPKKKGALPPRRNLRLEPLVEILEGRRIIHCHSYRQDEILALLRLAEELGFKIDVFIHVLEGYKVADALQAHGAMPSTFSDWWAYKFEVYDAIPYNGALMYDRGLTVSFNSDDAELARRLNTEAAKAVKYGGVPPTEALKFVTINSARQIQIDSRTGSLEPGKDADFVIWSGSPLSGYSVCEQTWIDGRKYFDREEDRKLRETAARDRNLLVQRILKPDGEKQVSPGPAKKGD